MSVDHAALASGIPQPIAFSIPTAVKVAGIGRSRMYELIAAGDIEAKKFGSKTLVVAASLQSYVANLPPATFRAREKHPQAAA